MKRHVVLMNIDTINGPESEEIDLDELPLERIFGMLNLMPNLWSYYDERMSKGLIERGNPELMSGESIYPITDRFLTSDDDDLESAARNVLQLGEEIPKRIKFKTLPNDLVFDEGAYQDSPDLLSDDRLCIELIAHFMKARVPMTWREVNPYERLSALQLEFDNRRKGISKSEPGHVFDVRNLDPSELEKRANRGIELLKIYKLLATKGNTFLEALTSTWHDDLIAELTILVFRGDGMHLVYEPKILAQIVLDRLSNAKGKSF